MSPFDQTISLSDVAIRLALTLVPMILSLSVHECAHAFAAYLLGDSTAKHQGRLTLNPISHVDPWGTLIIPAIGVVASATAGGGTFPFIGWARPTPYNPREFKRFRGRLGTAIVAAAGPLSNLVVAVISVAIIALCIRAGLPLGNQVEQGAAWHPTGLARFLEQMFALNVTLAVFNLIPIPPLDGSQLLPPVFDPILRRIRGSGFLLIMLIVFVFPSVGDMIIRRPTSYLMTQILALFGLG